MFEYPVGSSVRFLYDINNFDEVEGFGGPYFSIRIGQLAEVRDVRGDGWIVVAFGGNLYHVDSRYLVSDKQWSKIVENVAKYTKLAYQG